MIAAPPRVAVDDQNPWPGLEAFDEAAERFFNGRRDESAALRRLVLQAPLTVLFGASGLGKTSLLQAGLFPLLRQDRFLPVYVRLDLRDNGPLIEQVSAALQRELRERLVDAPAPDPGESLWEYLHRGGLELWSEDNRLLTPVFVIDQFEEVFTLGAGRAAAIGRLQIDLADLIENRIPGSLAVSMRDSEAAAAELSLDSQRYKVLLSFREDFLPAVEGLKRTIPSVMRNRLRLLPMSSEQAFEAVHRTAPHLVDEATAQRIVAFVAGAKEDGVERADGLSVEPALLSLVCRGLNEKRKAQKKARFDAALLEGTGQAIVADFYRATVADMPPHVRRFIQGELITERGFRKPCDLDDARRVHGVSEAHLRTLVDRRLLRIEPVRGTERVELTHDLLTPVVRERRDRDREQARLANEQQARRRLAAIGIVLAAVALGCVGLAIYFQNLRTEAEQTAASLERALAELTSLRDAERTARLQAEKAASEAKAAAASEAAARADADAKAREASEQRSAAEAALGRAEASRIQAEAAQKAAEAARQAADAAAERARKAAEGERVAAEQAAEEADRAMRASAEADRLRDLAVAQELAARARVLQRDEDLPLAAEMVVHAYLKQAQNGCATGPAPVAQCPADQFDPNILAALQSTYNRLSRRVPLRFGGGIISADAGGSILALDAGGVAQGTPILFSARPGARVLRIALPPDWTDLVPGGGPPPAADTLLRLERRVTAVAVAPGGEPLAAGDLDGLVTITPDAGWPPRPDAAAPITALVFTGDARAIVSGTGNGVLRRVARSGETRETVLPPGRDGRPVPIRALHVVPGGGAVLAATGEGIFRWDFSGAARALEGTVGLDVRSMAFDRAGERVAFGDRLGALRVAEWNGTSLGPVRTVDERHASSIDALAFAPGGRLLASGGADRTVRLFRLDGEAGGPPAVFDEHTGRVESVLFADDATVLSAGADGTIRRWSTRMDRLAAAVCALAGRLNLLPLGPSDQAALEVLLAADAEAPQSACAALDAAPGRRPGGDR